MNLMNFDKFIRSICGMRAKTMAYMQLDNQTKPLSPQEQSICGSLLKNKQSSGGTLLFTACRKQWPGEQTIPLKHNGERRLVSPFENNGLLLSI